MTIDATTLITATTEAEYMAQAFAKARTLGLDPDSWYTGDPTRSAYAVLSEALATKDAKLAEFIAGGILSLAYGDWLRVHALEVYGVEGDEARYATPTVTIQNTAGAYYDLDPGDISFRSSINGKTYHNTSGPHELHGVGTTATITLTADEPGSASTVGVNEIDEIITTYLGLAIVSSTASTGYDAQDPVSLKAECMATLGALSPNGPSDAYEFVATNHELTGEFEVTRAKAYGDSDTGDATLYVAGAGGAVTPGAVEAVLQAIARWAMPLCVTPAVVSASTQTVAVTATVTGSNIPADYATVAAAAIGAILLAIPISGSIYRSALIATLQVLAESGGATNVNVTLAAPAADVVLATGFVPVPGVITIG